MKNAKTFFFFFNFLHFVSDYGMSTNFGFRLDFEPKFWLKPKDVMIPKPKCIPKPKFRPKPKPKFPITNLDPLSIFTFQEL